MECKQCTITPAMLETTAATFSKGLLKDKLSELALIFNAYEALVAQASLVDPLDNLTYLAQKIPESHTFDGAYLYVDGFSGFTGQEMAVLEQLMPRVEALTVTLCTDTIRFQESDRFDRFAPAMNTAKKLMAAADRARIRKPIEKKCTENHRTADEALRALEAGCFKPDSPKYEEPTDAVIVTPCISRSEECRYAARLIRRLLREEGGHCRDFTIVSRAPAQYDELMESALRREGLPCCRDRREPVLTQPLITLVEAALAAVTRNFGNADVLRMVKSGLAGFSATSASMLENYVLMWNVRGKQWLEPFTENPNGLGKKWTPQAKRRLEYLNVLRCRLVNPLTELSDRLSGYRNGKQFAEAICVFLEDLRVARSVRLQVAQLDNAREFALADRSDRLWEYLMNLLDKFALGLANVPLPAKRLADLFHLAVSNDDLGSIPQALDGVTLGAVNRIRYTSPKTVIVLGANEGVLPAYPSSNGLFTDYDRRRLIEAQLPMSDCADVQTAEERFCAYAAVAAPSKRLVVTYATREGKDELFPSSLVLEIGRLTEKHVKGNVETFGSESEEDAFAMLAARYRENTPEAAAYRAVFDDKPLYEERLAAMKRLETAFAFEDADVAKDLFGNTMTISPTQAEKFSECRFAYFCNFGLHLNSREEAQFNRASSGTLVHYLLQTILPISMEAGIDTVTREQIHKDTVRLTAEYLDTLGGKDNRNATFNMRIERLTKDCETFLWRVVKELQQSQFKPKDYELAFGYEGNPLPPWTVSLKSGAAVEITGKIDRVDTFEKDGHTYVRVMDYKTGSKSFDVASMMAGIDVQLLIYLLVACQNGSARYGGEAQPAGMLYIPSKKEEFEAEGKETPEELEQKLLRSMCSSGLVLNNPEVVAAMEADPRGIFIPVALDEKGNPSGKSLATLAQFGKLKEHMEALLEDMVTTLHAGDIAAVPRKKKKEACSWCSYHDICGREASDPIEKLVTTTLEKALPVEVEDDE